MTYGLSSVVALYSPAATPLSSSSGLIIALLGRSLSWEAGVAGNSRRPPGRFLPREASTARTRRRRWVRKRVRRRGGRHQRMIVSRQKREQRRSFRRLLRQPTPSLGRGLAHGLLSSRGGGGCVSLPSLHLRLLRPRPGGRQRRGMRRRGSRFARRGY